jgi:hypothetical protein
LAEGQGEPKFNRAAGQKAQLAVAELDRPDVSSQIIRKTTWKFPRK